MKNSIHFLYCPFTGLGIHGGFRGNRWLKNRIRVFLEYVLKSLVNQTKQEFVVWISWRPEDKDNPLVGGFQRVLEGMRGMRFIHTFGGICFYDDKYDDVEAKRRLLGNLTATLPELKEYVGDAEEVYMTIQPSDDMYLSGYVKRVTEEWPNDREAMGFTNGYIINYATKELAEYNPTTTPPFATIRFRSEVFLNAEKHFKYIGPYESHEYVKDHLNEGFWSGRGFIVGTHGENISTTFNHPYKGRVIEGAEKERILLDAGIYFAEPLKINKGVRLLARQVLNRLPLQEKIRKFYHSLPTCLKIF